MAKEKQIKKTKKDDSFPFERENYIIIGIGLLVIMFGYIALSGNTVEGFVPLTLAPILLILGYCVIIPIGILYRNKEKKPEDQTLSQAVQQ
jgi:membrane protein CcdC involved in cytochrome C biogenesis